MVFVDIPIQDGNGSMPLVEPTGVHQARQGANGRGAEAQNNNGETSNPSTSTSENCDSTTNNVSSGQGQQLANNSNQTSSVNAGYIQNRTQGKNHFLHIFVQIKNYQYLSLLSVWELFL